MWRGGGGCSHWISTSCQPQIRGVGGRNCTASPGGRGSKVCVCVCGGGGVVIGFQQPFNHTGLPWGCGGDYGEGGGGFEFLDLTPLLSCHHGPQYHFNIYYYILLLLH